MEPTPSLAASYAQSVSPWEGVTVRLGIRALVIAGCVAVVAIGGSWLSFDRVGRRESAPEARRSEQLGVRVGTKVRSYRGSSHDAIIGSFQRDARSLARTATA
jgi:hypothetical protein